MNTVIEQPIPGFPGYYARTNGEIVSRKGDTPVVLKQQVTNNLAHVGLYVPDKGTVYIATHTCVLLAFVGPRPSAKHVATHESTNKLDNSLANVRWGLRSELIRNGIRQQFHVPDEAMHQAAADVTAIIAMSMQNENTVDIASKLNVSPFSIVTIQRAVIRLAKCRRSERQAKAA